MTSSRTELTGRSGDRDPGACVALVTGAAGAMGAAISQRLADQGSFVVAVDLDGAGAARMLVERGIAGIALKADLARTDAPAEIMALVRTETGRLDQLVNNAGLNRPQPLWELTADAWDAVQAVNLRAPALLCREALPFWREQGGGAIVNIGSRVWLSGAIPAYTSSKAGIVGLTRSLAVELGSFNVRANAVAPSYINTAFTRQDRDPDTLARMLESAKAISPLRRVGTPEDVANAVAFLLSASADFITGEVLHVCGGAQLAAQSYPFLADR